MGNKLSQKQQDSSRLFQIVIFINILFVVLHCVSGYLLEKKSFSRPRTDTIKTCKGFVSRKHLHILLMMLYIWKDLSSIELSWHFCHEEILHKGIFEQSIKVNELTCQGIPDKRPMRVAQNKKFIERTVKIFSNVLLFKVIRRSIKYILENFLTHLRPPR